MSASLERDDGSGQHAAERENKGGRVGSETGIGDAEGDASHINDLDDGDSGGVLRRT